MKVKRIIAVLFAVIVAIAAVPVQVRAEEVYTVVLKAGTVSGDVVVYRSDEVTVAESGESAANCQFYRCDNNGMGFKLEDGYCPASFTAPYGWYFDGWEGNNQYNDNISQTTTFTAKWWEKDTTASQGPIDGIPKTSRGEDFYLNGMKWLVIGEDKNRWLAISSELLSVRGSITMPWGDAMAYCGNVYDGFSDCEKVSLLKMTKTDEYYKYGDLLCDGIYAASSLNETGVFLLSIPEVNWYFEGNDALVCDGWHGWWLRSRLQDIDFALTVDRDGWPHNCRVESDDLSGCRPAFVLNRSSVLFTSAAEGGKSSVVAGSGFGNFQDGGTGEKKLTLLDSGRSGFSANIGGGNSAMVVPGGSVEIKYSGAGTGLNEYVSAMLCNSEGTVIGYASVVADSDGEGTWSLTLPDLTEGAVYKLKVFSEQQNGDHLTDYASTPVEIGLTVGSIPGWSPEAPADTVETVGTVEMHRLYNPNSGEHFYTGNVAEKDFLVESGWSYEGVAWNAPDFSLNPVYRLYDKNSGAHRYTMDEDKRDGFIAEGWSDEGIGWYSDETESIPVFGLYNKNALQAGAYHFTADTSERDSLIELGWIDEGIGWYGVTPAESEYVPGDTVILGSYEQDNDLSNGPEPIEWQVIGTRDGHTLLLSKYALDCKRYGERYMDTTWDNRMFRAWLNNDFYNKAFSASDMKRIVTAHNENPDSYELYKPWNSGSNVWGAEGGNTTDDKVFLLSWTEARDYFDGKLYDLSLGVNNYNQKLLCRPTDYAEVRGVKTWSNRGDYYPGDTRGCCWWWLWSPGDEQDDVTIVDWTGALSRSDKLENLFGIGVRPAILID